LEVFLHHSFHNYYQQLYTTAQKIPANNLRNSIFIIFVLARILSTKAREQLKGLNWERRIRRRKRRDKEKKRFIYISFMRLLVPLNFTMLF
jgi:hypothetical protein